MNEQKEILVIDDEPLILKTIERALKKVGHSVHAVRDRSEFMAQVRKGPVSLCIADLHMKDISLEDIRREVVSRNPAAKFLVVSGGEYEGPDFYLQKPFRIDRLRGMVRNILDSESAGTGNEE